MKDDPDLLRKIAQFLEDCCGNKAWRDEIQRLREIADRIESIQSDYTDGSW